MNKENGGSMGRRTDKEIGLTAVEVKAITKPGKHADGKGLYLVVSKSGSKSWMFRYANAGRQREMGLGSLRNVSLADARIKAEEARGQIGKGLDPLAENQRAADAKRLADAKRITFEESARQYIASHRAGWKNAKHVSQWENTLRDYVYPVFGKIPVQDVDTALVMKVLTPLWQTKTETASRLRGRIESVLDWATVSKFRSGENPAKWRSHLVNLLPKPSKVAKVVNHAALAYKEVGSFMANLRQQTGMGARALEFAILTAARSNEVRGATWAEIDLDNAHWTVPAGRMKASKEHRIPLSDTAIELLRALPRIDGCELLFPSSKNAMLSDMTLTAVIRRMGVVVTAHGFRSTFRDWAGETTAYPREVIEHALAHQLKDKAEAAYARGTLFDKRRRLMDDWAKYCNTVATVATVTPINKVRDAAHK